MKITYLIEMSADDDFKVIADKAVTRRKRSNYDEFILCEGSLIRIEKNDTVESLTEKYLSAEDNVSNTDKCSKLHSLYCLLSAEKDDEFNKEIEKLSSEYKNGKLELTGGEWAILEYFHKNGNPFVKLNKTEETEFIKGDTPNPKWAKLREQAAVTIGAAKLANSKAQTVEEIAQIAKSSVDFASILVKQLEISE